MVSQKIANLSKVLQPCAGSIPVPSAINNYIEIGLEGSNPSVHAIYKKIKYQCPVSKDSNAEVCKISMRQCKSVTGLHKNIFHILGKIS